MWVLWGTSEAAALLKLFPHFPHWSGLSLCEFSRGSEAEALTEAFPTLTALGKFLSGFFGVEQDKRTLTKALPHL